MKDVSLKKMHQIILAQELDWCLILIEWWFETDLVFLSAFIKHFKWFLMFGARVNIFLFKTIFLKPRSIFSKNLDFTHLNLIEINHTCLPYKLHLLKRKNLLRRYLAEIYPFLSSRYNMKKVPNIIFSNAHALIEDVLLHWW